MFFLDSGDSENENMCSTGILNRTLNRSHVKRKRISAKLHSSFGPRPGPS